MLIKPQFRARSRQAGLSLVEMMVGVAVGLFIVAGAATLVSMQLGENRRLLLETQVQQDLRAAADIITRELRRAGYLNQPHVLLWDAQKPTEQPGTNIRAGLRLNQGLDVVSYKYVRPNSATDDFGYQFVGNAIRQRISNTTQDLTDSSTLRINSFTVALQALPERQIACPNLCPGDTQDCWPTMKMVDATITIDGEAVSDPTVRRTIVSRVRLRNDAVDFKISATQVCP